MSNIDKRVLREAAEKALPAMKRLLMMPSDELFDEALLNVDGDVDAANAFNLLTGPETLLSLLDELEAKDRMVAELLNIISRHTIELGWGEKPISLAELIISREGSGSDALDAIRAAAAGKGEAS